MVKEVDNTKVTGLPEGVSDRINGKLLAPVVLKHHRQERKELIAMLDKKVKTTLIDNEVIMQPVYLLGNVVSNLDNQPVDEVSVWLKRNPFMMYRSGQDGKFEIMRKDVALYEKTGDALMMTAPGYKPTEVSLNSYINNNLVLKMEPLNYKPIVHTNLSVPTTRIPGGFFRMGHGLWQKGRLTNAPDGRDYETRNCWPIQTVSIPSFYMSQYLFSTRFRRDAYTWAKENGYKFTLRRDFMPFPLYANALSERDGFTPCYYTADLKIIRDEDDLSENMVCNWRADGYRMPTWAEFVYAAWAGRTTLRMYGDNGDAYKDYTVEYGSFYNENFEIKRTLSPEAAALPSGKVRSGIDSRVGGGPHARRKPLDWGIYGTTLGQSKKEITWDYLFWQPDNSFHPRGPNVRQARWMDSVHCNGKTRLSHFMIGTVDNLETQWFDKWTANSLGFQYSGYGFHLANLTFFSCDADSIGDVGISRFVRTAENICNDITLVKRNNDPNLKNPKPVKSNTINAELDMKPIPAGDFNMGSAFISHRWCRKARFPVGSCRPEHKVSLSSFSISKFEITVEQWRNIQNWAKKNGYTDLAEGSLGTSSSNDLKHPVVNISWYDAIKWCNANSEKNGLTPCYTLDGKVLKTGGDDNVVCDWNVNGYRLPTEAEWEYASQAGSDGSFYWGDDKGLKYCWRGGRTGKNAEGVSHPVGQKYGNLFGLYDTIGNVWEWTWDWKGPHYLNLDSPKDPKGPKNPKVIKDYLAKIKKAKGADAKALGHQKLWIGKAKFYKGGRTLKGGAYNTEFGYHNFLGAQFRAGCKPEKSDNAIGFRVVRGK